MISEDLHPIELLPRVRAFAPVIFAVDNLRLVGMHLQTTLRKAPLKTGLDGHRLTLTHAVNQPVVSVPTPRVAGMSAFHPDVEGIVHEQIRQHRTDYAALRSPAGALYEPPIRILHRRTQPALDV